mmetsp:Transcript_92707/g.206054  ORF Transcript_92707/g.206054 Transcript_92707/m.206054 type:complete len:325 (+) Transcript_92707:876-1850(+)
MAMQCRRLLFELLCLEGALPLQDQHLARGLSEALPGGGAIGQEQFALSQQLLSLPLHIHNLLGNQGLHHGGRLASHLQVDLGPVPHQLGPATEFQGAARLLPVCMLCGASDDEAGLGAATKAFRQEPRERRVSIGHQLHGARGPREPLDYKRQLREGFVDLASLPALVPWRPPATGGRRPPRARPRVGADSAARPRGGQVGGHGPFQALAPSEIHEVEAPPEGGSNLGVALRCGQSEDEVGATAAVIHVRACCLPPPHALAERSQGLLGAGGLTHRGIFAAEAHALLVGAHLVDLHMAHTGPGCEKVPHPLVVDLQHGDLDGPA